MVVVVREEAELITMVMGLAFMGRKQGGGGGGCGRANLVLVRMVLVASCLWCARGWWWSLEGMKKKNFLFLASEIKGKKLGIN